MVAVASASTPTYSYSSQATQKDYSLFDVISFGPVFLLFQGNTLLNTSNRERKREYNLYSNTGSQYHALSFERSQDSLSSANSFDLLKIKNLETIRKIACFEYDWNGNGAKPFSETSINLFSDIISELDKQPVIAPTGRNSLLMQYTLDDKSMLAFEVSERKVDKVYVPQGNFALATTDVFVDAFSKQIKDSVRHFYGQKQN